MKRALIAAALCLSFLPLSAAMAEEGIKVQQVQFKKGESNASLQGKIAGHQTLDYVLSAKADQSMVVNLTGKSSTYFNVLPPKSEEAIFIGSTLGNRYEGKLPASGQYRIRVYQMGAAEQSSTPHSFKLDIGISN